MLLQFGYPCNCDNTVEKLLETDTISARSTFPSIDIAERENEVVVLAELAGVKKEGVKVAFENSVLTISGERKQDDLSKDFCFLLQEIGNHEFSRSIRFGIDVEADKISAEMNDGILKVTLPKTDEVKARQIQIQ